MGCSKRIGGRWGCRRSVTRTVFALLLGWGTESARLVSVCTSHMASTNTACGLSTVLDYIAYMCLDLNCLAHAEKGTGAWLVNCDPKRLEWAFILSHLHLPDEPLLSLTTLTLRSYHSRWF